MEAHSTSRRQRAENVDERRRSSTYQEDTCRGDPEETGIDRRPGFDPI